MHISYKEIEETPKTIGDSEVFMDVIHEYPDITVHLTLFNATIAEGEPQKLEHNAKFSQGLERCTPVTSDSRRTSTCMVREQLSSQRMRLPLIGGKHEPISQKSEQD